MGLGCQAMKMGSYIHASLDEPLEITFDGNVVLIAYCGGEKLASSNLPLVWNLLLSIVNESECCMRCVGVPRDRRRKMAERSG